MDVNTQKNIVMSMKEWQKYFDDPVRDKLLNVLSLEFSHTKLDNYVQSPAIVSTPFSTLYENFFHYYPVINWRYDTKFHNSRSGSNFVAEECE